MFVLVFMAMFLCEFSYADFNRLVWQRITFSTYFLPEKTNRQLFKSLLLPTNNFQRL
jgi:hypothetical protein